MVVSLKILINAKFSQALMNPRIVKGQNEHNSKNQRKYLDREVYEYYYLDLEKRLNSSRHHVHYSTK